MPELDDPRREEQLRLTVGAPGLSAWQRFCPVETWRDPILRSMEEYLDLPETRELFDRHEVSEDYPDTVLNRLRELGLAQILAPRS